MRNKSLRFSVVTVVDLDKLKAKDYASVVAILDQHAPGIDYLYFVSAQDANPAFGKWWPPSRVSSWRVSTEWLKCVANGEKRDSSVPKMQMSFCELISLAQRSDLIITDSEIPEWAFSYETPIIAFKRKTYRNQIAQNNTASSKMIFPIVRPEESEVAFKRLLAHCEKYKISVTLFYKTLLGTLPQGLAEAPRLYYPSELEIEHERVEILENWVTMGRNSNVEMVLVSDVTEIPFENSVLKVIQSGKFDFLAFCPTFMNSYFWGRAAKRVIKKAPCNVWIPYPTIQDRNVIQAKSVESVASLGWVRKTG